MPTARVSLAQPIESRTDSISKDSRATNCLFETRDQTKKELVKRPGLESVLSLTAGQAYGFYGSMSYLWAVIGTTLYRIDPVAGTSTNCGTINSGQYSFTQSGPAQNYIFLHDDTNAYYIAPAGTTPTAPGNESITAYTVTNAGTGYTTIPSATVTGGGGSSATANVFLGVVTATVGSGGTGYAVNDVLSFVSTGGTAVTACVLTVSAVSSGSVISSISLISRLRHVM